MKVKIRTWNLDLYFSRNKWINAVASLTIFLETPANK